MNITIFQLNIQETTIEMNPLLKSVHIYIKHTL